MIMKSAETSLEAPQKCLIDQLPGQKEREYLPGEDRSDGILVEVADPMYRAL